MQRAQPKFKKLPGVEAGIDARSEDDAAAGALADKIARLKELRLARDAAEKAAPAIEVKKVGKKNGKKKPPPVISLSDWLKNRQAAGHSH